MPARLCIYLGPAFITAVSLLLFLWIHAGAIVFYRSSAHNAAEWILYSQQTYSALVENERGGGFQKLDGVGH